MHHRSIKTLLTSFIVALLFKDNGRDRVDSYYVNNKKRKARKPCVKLTYLHFYLLMIECD